MRQQQISTQTYKIITQYGDMLVVKQGIANRPTNQNHHQHHSSNTTNAHHHHHYHHHHHQGSTGGGGGDQAQPTRPVLMTFHDLGLNSELQFATFCKRDEVKLMLQTFTMIHVNFIGQEFNSQGQAVNSLPDDYKYPTVEQMAECIVDICAQLRVRSFIALAVGAGAHIVSTLALIRPDLVHGLFLINPVISSCSITEWLYFKMSAIASNRQILGSNAHHHPHHHQQHQLGTGSSAASSMSGMGSDDHSSLGDADQHHHHHHSSSSGFKKLWKAVNHHHHHHHSSHNSHNYQMKKTSECTSVASVDSTDERAVGGGGGGGGGGSGSGGDEESPSESPHPPLTQTPSRGNLFQNQSDKPAASSRLRQLILSRNFRLGKHHAHASHASSLSNAPPTTSDESQQTQRGNDNDHHHEDHDDNNENQSQQQEQQQQQQQDSSSPIRTETRQGSPAGGSSNSRPRRASSSSQASSSTSSSAGSGKRPPLEYLMYHHFGTATLQRFRRMSSDLQTSGVPSSLGGSLRGGECAPTDDSLSRDQELRNDFTQGGGPQHRGSSDSTSSNQSGTRRALAGMNRQHRGSHGSARGTGDNDSQRSQDSLSRATSAVARSGGGGGGSGSRLHQRLTQRSHSVCLDASYLASFSSDRQRCAYMQNVYKKYFIQVNAHNLWLFAQAFAKRRTLNLRKDCGAAAHAAAAAAALGTSICAAFVGVGGPGGAAAASASIRSESACGAGSKHHQGVSISGAANERHPSETSAQETAAATVTDEGVTHETGPQAAKVSQKTAVREQPAHHHHHHHHHHHQQQQQQQQQASPKAVVAGTKVKRTFTCQTLIMCSSVHIHRERALKLMSLLNPLQATWIKTDQLLVLEEKPEKVCQALRLFLQGIGYSMSTYERRLRLSSAQASISSAESNGSARSLNLESSSAGTREQQHQQQQQSSQQQQQQQVASLQKSSSSASSTGAEAAPVAEAAAAAAAAASSSLHQKMST